MNKDKRLEIFTRFRNENPKPETELNYSSNFELLVAVTLSAQSTDVGVNKATDKLFPVANNPEAIYALGIDGLSGYIKTIGLYNSKAKNVRFFHYFGRIFWLRMGGVSPTKIIGKAGVKIQRVFGNKCAEQ